MIDNKYIIFIFVVLLILSVVYSGSISNDNLHQDVPAKKIYVAEGYEFLEVDADKFQVNRTLELNGTSVEINYDNNTNNLYAAVGAVNYMHEIDASKYEINRSYSKHTFNVHDVIPRTDNGFIYTLSSDNSVHKISYKNFTKLGSYDQHDGSVMFGEYVDTHIYTATLDFTIAKINSSNMSESNRIEGFPETLSTLSYDRKNNTMYYGGALGSVYRIDLDNFDKYSTYDDIPKSNYNNIEFDKSSDEVDRTKIDSEDYGFIRLEYDNKENVIYGGGSKGILYKIDPETLNVIDTYSVKKNRVKDYDFSEYSSPSIEGDKHIYNYDIRGVELGPKSEYVYITTTPGALIELSTDNLSENRRLRTGVESRIVSLEVR